MKRSRLVRAMVWRGRLGRAFRGHDDDDDDEWERRREGGEVTQMCDRFVTNKRGESEATRKETGRRRILVGAMTRKRCMHC